MSISNRDVRDVPDRKPSDELLKPDVEHRSIGSNEISEVEAGAVDERKLLRKIDLHLLPVLSLLYLLRYVSFCARQSTEALSGSGSCGRSRAAYLADPLAASSTALICTSVKVSHLSSSQRQCLALQFAARSQAAGAAVLRRPRCAWRTLVAVLSLTDLLCDLWCVCVLRGQLSRCRHLRGALVRSDCLFPLPLTMKQPSHEGAPTLAPAWLTTQAWRPSMWLPIMSVGPAALCCSDSVSMIAWGIVITLCVSCRKPG